MGEERTRPELAQVLAGLARNRTPGWNYPGNFLDISFDEVAPGGARLSLEPGPHCVLADGQVHLGALGMLADVALAAAMRPQVGLATRMATVSMSLSLTGMPLRGRLVAESRFDGFVQAAAGQQGNVRGEMRADGVLIGTANASFVAIGAGEGMAPMAMSPSRRDGQLPSLDVGELTEPERAIHERAQAALQPPQGSSFIEQFWGILPQPVEGGAACDFANGLHVGNRVGHLQGGLGWALAAITASAALGDDWRLVGASAWYLNPGKGERLAARSQILQSGRLVAIVGARIADSAGATVIEAVTQHARRG